MSASVDGLDWPQAVKRAEKELEWGSSTDEGLEVRESLLTAIPISSQVSSRSLLELESSFSWIECKLECVGFKLKWTSTESFLKYFRIEDE